MTDHHIVGHVITRNEAGRYLRPCLQWLSTMVDTIYVYDDRSTDGTLKIADDYAIIQQRHEMDPSFIDNESWFREAAWTWMAGFLEEGTWVLCVDADEFPVSNAIERRVLETLASEGQSVTFPVAEVFGWEHERPLVRTDGYWKSITAHRFVRFVEGSQKFVMRAEGGGSVPAYAAGGQLTQEMTFLHLGYADAADRQLKYIRYSSGRGHSSAHVESILGRTNLRPWTGALPEVELK